MATHRSLPLFDPAARPQSWNERMVLGEYAVLYSASVESGPNANTCDIFPSLEEAESFAEGQLQRWPMLRCRIYDSNGLGAAPVRELRGPDYRGEHEMSARFRRWAGSLLFLGGLTLFVIDWRSGYEMLWPGTIGTRMIPVGLFLLVVDLVITMRARRARAAETS